MEVYLVPALRKFALAITSVCTSEFAFTSKHQQVTLRHVRRSSIALL